MLQRALTLRGGAPSDRFIDTSLVAYAIWTITCHAVMLLGGNTYALATATLASLALSTAAFAGWWWWRRKRPSLSPSAASAAPVAEVEPVEGVPSTREQLALGLLGVVIVALWLWLRDPMTQWLLVSGYLLLAWGLTLRGPLIASDRAAPVLRWQEVALWLVALGCGFLAMYTHRWRNDDCYYVNLAVTVADHPEAPLLSIHTLHAAIGANPYTVFPPYRIHSFEALGGLISHVTGIDAIRVLHIGAAGVAGALIPLAFARLFRLLDRERWFYMTLAVLCMYLVDGSGDRGFSNQGIVRVFTGKSVMLSVAMPLIVCYGIALGLRPRLATVGLLAAGQIAAVGLSSTALWMAPVTAMLAVGATLRRSMTWLRAAVLGLVSCGYVVAIALWVRSHVMTGGTKGEASRALAVTSGISNARFDLLSSSFDQNIGNNEIVVITLSLLLFSIPLARTALARRYLVTASLVVALVLMNPYFANFLRHNVFGKYTGQRAFWVAPLPVAFGAVFVALIPVSGRALLRWLGVLGGAAALALFCWLVPSEYVLSQKNNVIFKWPPGPKVPSYAFAVSESLSRNLSEDDVVLAPELVSWYLPTVHHHPKPLLANAKYMTAEKGEEYRLQKLVDLVGKSKGSVSDEEKADLIKWLDRYGVDAVVLKTSGGSKPPLGKALKEAKFKKVPGASGYQVWVRPEHAEHWKKS
jgi:hypothetical protein